LPQLAGAAAVVLIAAVGLARQSASLVIAVIGIGAGIAVVLDAGSQDPICVCRMIIGAPQQAHRTRGRTLALANTAPGSNFKTRCSKAIMRLQLGCRNPKLRARRKRFWQHMLQHQK